MAIPAIHPGEHLAEELKEVRMSAAALARLLEVPTNRITEILNGRRAVTGDTALRLGHFFGTSAEFWLNLQKLYELRLAEEKGGKGIRALPTLKDCHAEDFGPEPARERDGFARVDNGDDSGKEFLELAGIEGADLYREWETHIEDQRARAAFRLLVDSAASLPHLVLSFRKKGVLKTCRLHDRSGQRPRLPYSFIVNRSWIKFYFRFGEARAGKDALKRDFDSFEDGNSKGEWTVMLRTEEDVRLLLTHLRGNVKLFDGYVAVDWSASSVPKRGENSIWLAVRGTGRTMEYENPATRQEAREYIETLLRTATAAGRRLLCGFDFPFGYPASTAQALTGRAGWETVWSRVAELIEDGPRNRNNRFKVAAKLNAHFDGDGPFYGNGLKEDIPGLPRNKPCWGANLPPTRRYAESKVKSAQEVWKLLGNGSVGGQALTGIAALEHLRHRTGARVWPFETLGEGRSHVLAEIYPSLIEPDPGPEVKDQRQVSAVATALQTLDEYGELGRYLDVPSEMPDAVHQEEGLILGMQDPAGFQRAARCQR